MNDILELWSLPWHALQKSLAEAFGGENVWISTAEAGGWLSRARGRSTPGPQPGRKPQCAVLVSGRSFATPRAARGAFL